MKNLEGIKIKLKLGPIQLFVSDLEKAKRWYSNMLGMKLLKEYPKFKCILMKFGKIEFDIGVPNPSWGKGWKKVKVGGKTSIVFETDDIFKATNKLKKKGVRFIEEPCKKSWGEYKAVFIDPDGNEFSLIQVLK
jgi:catechol 2,3-dioxygenase-like lactoylglutathione lyase family enzyme